MEKDCTDEMKFLKSNYTKFQIDTQAYRILDYVESMQIQQFQTHNR